MATSAREVSFADRVDDGRYVEAKVVAVLGGRALLPVALVGDWGEEIESVRLTGKCYSRYGDARIWGTAIRGERTFVPAPERVFETSTYIYSREGKPQTLPKYEHEDLAHLEQGLSVAHASYLSRVQERTLSTTEFAL